MRTTVRTNVRTGTVTLIFDSHNYAFLGWTAFSHPIPITRVSLILQKIVNRPPSFK